MAATAAGVTCVAFPNENTAGHDFGAAARRVDRLDFAELADLAADPPGRRDRLSAARHRPAACPRPGQRRHAWTTRARRTRSVPPARRPESPPMAAPEPTYTATDTAFHVEAYEQIDYSLRYVDGAFAIGEPELADSYRPFGRCLMVVDDAVYEPVRRADAAPTSTTTASTLTVFPWSIRETDKTLRTVERIVDAFGDFGLVRNEPVLVVGGGLTTDVAGFACAIFRRATNYIRVPDHPDRADRRQRRDQGRGEPRQVQEPARRLPRLAEGDPRLLVPARRCRSTRCATAWPS